MMGVMALVLGLGIGEIKLSVSVMDVQIWEPEQSAPVCYTILWAKIL